MSRYALTEIADAIHRLNTTLFRHSLHPIQAITLGHPDDMTRLLALPEAGGLRVFVDTAPQGTIKLHGTEVHPPAVTPAKAGAGLENQST